MKKRTTLKTPNSEQLNRNILKLSLKGLVAAQKRIEDQLTSKFEKKFAFRDWQVEAIQTIGANYNKHNTDECLTGLCTATCGAGKSTLQATLIDAVANECESKNERACIVIAAHRLTLLGQLTDGFFAKIPNFKERFNLVDLNSSGKHDRLAKDKILAVRGAFGTGSKKHVLIVACDASLNSDVNVDDSSESLLEMITEVRRNLAKAGSTKINLVQIDECHKEIKNAVLEKLKKLTDFMMLYSATPTRANEKLANFTIEHCFRDALKAGEVVSPNLYTCKTAGLGVDEKANCIIYSMRHLIRQSADLKNGVGKVAKLAVFDNGVDNMNRYAASIRAVFSEEELMIVILATKKQKAIKDRHGVIQARDDIETKVNGKPVEDKEALNAARKSKIPVVILSAFKLNEGIDIVDLNGILLLCEKNDPNLYQSCCRADRVNDKDKSKKHFNIYFPSCITSNIPDFFATLTNGFDNMLNFGDGEDPESRSGSKNPDNEDLSSYDVVPAKACKQMRIEIEKVRDAYEAEHAEQLITESFLDDCRKIYENGGERVDCTALMCEDKYRSQIYVLLKLDDQIDAIWGI